MLNTAKAEEKVTEEVGTQMENIEVSQSADFFSTLISQKLEVVIEKETNPDAQKFKLGTGQMSELVLEFARF